MAFYITGGAEHDEVEANKDQRIAELTAALEKAANVLELNGLQLQAGQARAVLSKE